MTNPPGDAALTHVPAATADVKTGHEFDDLGEAFISIDRIGFDDSMIGEPVVIRQKLQSGVSTNIIRAGVISRPCAFVRYIGVVTEDTKKLRYFHADELFLPIPEGQ